MPSTLGYAQEAHVERFTLAFHLQLPLFHLYQIQASGRLRRLTDQNLAWAGLGSQAGGDVAIIPDPVKSIRLPALTSISPHGNPGFALRPASRPPRLARQVIPR